MIDTSLSEKIQFIERKKISDERGWFLKTLTGKEEGLPNFTGEIYTVCAYPNQVRGGHYHKIAKEWFTLLKGNAILKLKDINTHEELCIELDGNNYITIVIPPFVAHQFENVSETEFLLLAYTNVLYVPEDTIPIIF